MQGDGAADRLPWRALVTLGLAMFVAQTLEFLPGGLLPHISQDLDRPLSLTGQLVTAFAAAVVLTTAPVSALTRRVPRRRLLTVALLVVAAAAAAGALAPSFGALLTARVVAGVAHGAFWVAAGSYAAYLVPHHLLGRAMAVTGLGGSLAGILGIPLGNALGQVWGWRTAFAAVAALTLLMTVVVRLVVPPVAHLEPAGVDGTGAGPDATEGARGGPARSVWEGTGRPVALVCVVLLLVVLGPGVFSTYSVPWLQTVAGLPSGLVPLYLLVGGLAGTLGLVATGALYDRYPRASFLVAGGVAAAALGGIALVGAAGSPGGVLAVQPVWAAAFACLPAMLQARVMKTVSRRARPLAAALVTTAVNVGFALGAAGGGVVLEVWSLEALPWVACVVLAAGVALLVAADSRRPRPAGARHGSPRPAEGGAHAR